MRTPALRRAAVAVLVAVALMSCSVVGGDVDLDDIAERAFSLASEDEQAPVATMYAGPVGRDGGREFVDLSVSVEGRCSIHATLVVTDNQTAVVVIGAPTGPCGRAADDLADRLSTVDQLQHRRRGEIGLRADGELVAVLTQLESDGHA